MNKLFMSQPKVNGNQLFKIKNQILSLTHVFTTTNQNQNLEILHFYIRRNLVRND